MTDLERFIVQAKARGFVGNMAGGRKVEPSRIDAHDLVYDEGEWHYRDSYVGNARFCGQEHVAFHGRAVWSMAYYGYLLRPDRLTGDEAGRFLTDALSQMYAENRFLGGFRFTRDRLEYRDMNLGDYRHFSGIEKIHIDAELVYELQYAGGIMEP